jgi:hypothetical protein
MLYVAATGEDLMGIAEPQPAPGMKPGIETLLLASVL